MPDNSRYLGRGLQFPLRPGPDGGFRKDRETSRIIQSGIGIILMTRIGERVWLPEFGSNLTVLKHEPNGPETWQRIQDEALAAIKRWEPRITNLQVIVQPSRSRSHSGKFLVNVLIKYRIIATNKSDNFVFPFYLES